MSSSLTLDDIIGDGNPYKQCKVFAGLSPITCVMSSSLTLDDIIVYRGVSKYVEQIPFSDTTPLFNKLFLLC
jgi:hypothetical protein